MTEDQELAALRARRRAALESRASPVSSTSGEGVTLTLWCAAHMAPYKLDRTLNRVMASKLLTDALLSDEPFQHQCGRDDEAGTLADSTRIHAEGAKLGPVCCYLGEDRPGLVLVLVRASRDRATLAAADNIIRRETAAEGHGTALGPGGAAALMASWGEA